MQVWRFCEFCPVERTPLSSASSRESNTNTYELITCEWSPCDFNKRGKNASKVPWVITVHGNQGKITPKLILKFTCYLFIYVPDENKGYEVIILVVQCGSLEVVYGENLKLGLCLLWVHLTANLGQVSSFCQQKQEQTETEYLCQVLIIKKKKFGSRVRSI